MVVACPNLFIFDKFVRIRSLLVYVAFFFHSSASLAPIGEVSWGSDRKKLGLGGLHRGAYSSARFAQDLPVCLPAH